MEDCTSDTRLHGLVSQLLTVDSQQVADTLSLSTVLCADRCLNECLVYMSRLNLRLCGPNVKCLLEVISRIAFLRSPLSNIEQFCPLRDSDFSDGILESLTLKAVVGTIFRSPMVTEIVSCSSYGKSTLALSLALTYLRGDTHNRKVFWFDLSKSLSTEFISPFIDMINDDFDQSHFYIYRSDKALQNILSSATELIDEKSESLIVLDSPSQRPNMRNVKDGINLDQIIARMKWLTREHGVHVLICSCLISQGLSDLTKDVEEEMSERSIESSVKHSLFKQPFSHFWSHCVDCRFEIATAGPSHDSLTVELLTGIGRNLIVTKHPYLPTPIIGKVLLDGSDIIFAEK